jgi:hypothetical protein
MNTLLDKENYFDQAESLHTVLTLWHEGQWSTKYRLLCASQFKPGPMWNETQVELENQYFHEIESWRDDDKKLEKLMNEINEYLESER